MRRFAVLVVALVACLGPVATASASFSPEAVVTGSPNSKWFSGSLIQQYGTNCATAVLGSAYSEVMVSGIGSYGGAPGGGLVHVGDQYWTSLLVSIPGNPCGSGSSVVATDLVLPPGTAVDSTRPIQCFGASRASTTGFDSTLTGGRWTAFGSSGDYCPTQVGASTVVAGAVSVGYRPLASGQLFQIFVPVKSTGVLPSNGSQSPPDGFRWLTQATGVYANPGLSTTNAYVFPSSTLGTSPTVYFARSPSAHPYWDATQTTDAQRNRVELWANFYTAGKGGTISYKIVRNDTHATIWTSAQDTHFNGAVADGNDLIQITPGSYKGPDGGYSPVAFDPPGVGGVGGEWNVPMTITWTYTPNGGSGVSGSTDFRTLAGPDADGDGVSDAFDACPAQPGNGANGCTAVTATTTLDQLGGAVAQSGLCGIAGAAACPTASTEAPAAPTTDGSVAPSSGGAGSGGGSPATAAPVKPATALLALGKKPTLKRSGLTGKKGLLVSGTCTAGAAATLTLVASKPTAKALKLKSTPLPALATASATCQAGTSTTFTLKPAPALLKKLKALRASITATLTLRATTAGAPMAASSSVVSIK